MIARLRNFRSGPRLGLLAALALSCGTVCGSDPASKVPRYRDVTRESGIHFIHLRGSKEKDYLVETKGGGCAIFDFDGDGLEDIYLVNGSTFEHLERGTGPGNALYRNEGNWRFREVAEAAGAADTWPTHLRLGPPSEMGHDGAGPSIG